ncbi:hypothetical protein KSF_068980 [Reticulibacter mediterranei]|uniref:DUF169 domain-containing protein n=1 Tax=Reticulibacter mediterranei TaxID=2778369 RepID=A0A8J3N5X6_9CHLR|nr:DUF169 domain-containing protein [Reticulibacter mediterranei]GHO96850.1 hypothetical protein KSF_068980 [Reticulibacter mediterranei]
MYQDLTKRFVEALQLQHTPVGLAFVETVPENVQHVARRVPSACTFWRLGEQGVFYANAEDHQECPIGMMTMGFTMPASAQERAQGLVQTMASVKYFSPDEVSALPVVKKPHESIVYGRLDQLPVEADVVLCILNTQQAMLVAEALGQVNWLQSGQSAFGRPTCGVIPRTLMTGETSMSFGCVGARTYIELSPAEVVLTIPAAQFADLVGNLETIVAANAALAPFHQQQKANFGG